MHDSPPFGQATTFIPEPVASVITTTIGDFHFEYKILPVSQDFEFLGFVYKGKAKSTEAMVLEAIETVLGADDITLEEFLRGKLEAKV